MAVCSNKHENDEPCYTTASRSGAAGWEGRAAPDCREEAGIPDRGRAREEGACRVGPACMEEVGRADPGCRAAVEEACWARARGCRAREEAVCRAGPGCTGAGCGDSAARTVCWGCTARERAQEGKGGWGHREEGCGGSAARRDGWGRTAQETAQAQEREDKDDWDRTAQETAQAQEREDKDDWDRTAQKEPEGRGGWGHKAREQEQARKGKGGWGHREEGEGCEGRREGAAACRAGSSRRARGSTGARAT